MTQTRRFRFTIRSAAAMAVASLFGCLADEFPDKAKDQCPTEPGLEIHNGCARDGDGDQMWDWWEAQYGFDYNDPAVPLPGDDTDGDGLTNVGESQKYTSPNSPDTDFDGINDDTDPCPLQAGPNNGCP